MSGKADHFLKLLKVEFDDIHEDIGLLEAVSMDRLKNAEITNYVYHENYVVFEQERRAVHSLAKILDEAAWGGYEDPRLLRDDLLDHFEKKIHELQHPPAVMSMIRRKIEKIHQFILS